MKAPSKGRRGRQLLRATHGFSLIELLIVVAVIMIIAAIAIPNFLRSRMAANEAAAVASLRNITTANVVYHSTYGTGFAASLAVLGPPGGGGPPTATNAALIDDVLATGSKSGYIYTYTPAAPMGGMINSYTLTAAPIVPGRSGTRFFFIDESGVIRANGAGPADVNSTPIS